MGERVQPLIEAAKLLSAKEREELVEGLLQIDGQFEPDAADSAEWARRFAEIETGHVSPVDADEAIAAARSDLARRRRT